MIALALLAAAQMYGQMMPTQRQPAAPVTVPRPTPTPTPRPAQPAQPAQPAPAVPAAALTPEQLDGRCLFAFAYLSGQPGETAQVGRFGVMYFYGKLAGRNPALDLSGTLRGAAAAVGGEVQPELIRCGGELQASADAMRRADAALKGPAAPVPTPTPTPSPRPVAPR